MDPREVVYQEKTLKSVTVLVILIWVCQVDEIDRCISYEMDAFFLILMILNWVTARGLTL
jgi:predicted cation transporter